MNFCTSKTGGIEGKSLQRQYLLFLFLKHHCKKLSIPKLSNKTCKNKNNYYYCFKT